MSLNSDEFNRLPLETVADRLQLALGVGGEQRNYHRNQIADGAGPLRFKFGAVIGLRQPQSEAAVATTASSLSHLCDWARANGWTLRAPGSKWSFSDAMAPGKTLQDSRSIAIDTRIFKKSWPLSNSNLPYITSGANLHNMNAALQAAGFSLKTSGSSDGQTLAGALGTGVHGSAYRFGALHDSVRALHLATPQGAVLVCRRTGGITEQLQDELCTKFAIPRREVSDQLFDAVSVSFGSFGVVVGAAVEVEAKYALHVIRRTLPRADVPKLITALKADTSLGAVNADFACAQGESHHHCQLLINPYDPSGYKIVVMNQKTGHVPAGPFAWPEGIDASGVELIRLVWNIAHHLTDAYAALVGMQFSKMADFDAWGYRSEIFGTPDQPLPVHSLAAGVPIDEVPKVLDLAHGLMATHKFPGAGELRFVKPSPASLAVNRFAPLTAVVGFDGIDIATAWAFSRAFFAGLRAAQIPFTFHWGKMNDLGADPVANATTLEAMYAGRLKSWRDERVDFLGDGAAVFNNEFVVRSGIVR